MTTPYSGYGYGRATRRERKDIARRDSIIARYWHSRLTHEECDGSSWCQAATLYNGRHDHHAHSPRRYYTGHLHAPCSRYGRDGDECAWWAIAAAFIAWEANGDAPTWESLDYYQGLAANDSDSIAEMVWSNWHAVPPFVRRHIGTRTSVLALAYDPAALRAEYGQ